MSASSLTVPGPGVYTHYVVHPPSNDVYNQVTAFVASLGGDGALLGLTRGVNLSRAASPAEAPTLRLTWFATAAATALTGLPPSCWYVQTGGAGGTTVTAYGGNAPGSVAGTTLASLAAVLAGVNLFGTTGWALTTVAVPGPANSLAIGTVTTGAGGSLAAATVTGAAPTQTLNLTIPQGVAGANGVAGAGFQFRGAWQPGTAYAVQDVVTYQGSTYVTTTAFTSGSAFNPANWSTLVAGSSGQYLVVAANYAMTGAEQVVLADTSGGPVTVTLPDAAAVDGRQFRFKSVGTATNNLLKLSPFTATQTVDGAPSRTLMVNDGVTVVSEGGVWKVLAVYYPGTRRLIYSQKTVKSGDTISGTTTPTSFASGVDVPANGLVAGTEFSIEFYGSYTTPALSTATTARLLLGSTVVLTTPALNNPAGASGLGYSGTIKLMVVTTGTTGTVRCSGVLNFAATTTTGVVVVVPATVTTVDTTAIQHLALGVIFSTNNAGNSNTLQQLAVYEGRPVQATD